MMREREKKAKEDKMAAEMEERQQRRKEVVALRSFGRYLLYG